MVVGIGLCPCGRDYKRLTRPRCEVPWSNWNDVIPRGNVLIHRGDALISPPGRGEIARKTVYTPREEKMLRSLDKTLTYYYY